MRSVCSVERPLSQGLLEIGMEDFSLSLGADDADQINELPRDLPDAPGGG